MKKPAVMRTAVLRSLDSALVPPTSPRFSTVVTLCNLSPFGFSPCFLPLHRLFYGIFLGLLLRMLSLLLSLAVFVYLAPSKFDRGKLRMQNQ